MTLPSADTLIPDPTSSASSSTILLLIRHGETAWNKAGRIQGHTDIPLSDVGLAQARMLVRRWLPPATKAGPVRQDDMLAAGALGRGSGDVVLAGDPASSVPRDASPWVRPLTAVVSSDLSRAAQTAAPLLQALAPDTPLKAITHMAGLRERAFVVFEQQDKQTIERRWPVAYGRWITHDPDFAPEGGESLRALYQRVIGTLGEQARRHIGGTVACVAHGGVLDCAFRFAHGVPLDVPRACVLRNASINVLRWYSGTTPEQDRAEVLAWGDVAHLADMAADEARDDRV